MSDGYRLGAVVYHPKVEQIWQRLRRLVRRAGLRAAPRYYERYEDQVDDLIAGRARRRVEHQPRPRAHAAAHRRRGRRAGDARHRPRLAQPDRRARRRRASSRSRICAGGASGFGDADSPQAQILPVHALRAQGWDPLRDFEATRLDRDVGKHGDTGGAELAQLARVRAGELDACVISSVTLDAIERWAMPPGSRPSGARRRSITAASPSCATTPPRAVRRAAVLDGRRGPEAVRADGARVRQPLGAVRRRAATAT